MEAVTEVDESLEMASSLDANTNALVYETNVLDVGALWHMARAPRMRVFAIRDRVFGVKGKDRLGSALSRSRIGVRDSSLSAGDAHGRYNRPQKMLNGKTRFVDFLGRTESDVEEEEELPEDVNLEQHRRESGAADDTDEELGNEDISKENRKESKAIVMPNNEECNVEVCMKVSAKHSWAPIIVESAQSSSTLPWT